MATVEHRIGDLFAASDVDALAHGCNCAGAMGRGIALEFKRRWPSMYEEYRQRCRSDRFKVGDVFPWRSPEGVTIYNLGTQKHWRAGAELPAVVTAVDAMLNHAAAHGVRRIAMPRIAAGLGGLDWVDVEKSITPVIESARPEVIIYELG